MEITFHSAKLRDLCEKRGTAAAKLGYTVARELAQRLADIEAVDTLAELSELLGDVVSRKSETEVAVSLNSGIRLVFSSGHPTEPGSAATMKDWKAITRIKLLRTEPVHA